MPSLSYLSKVKISAWNSACFFIAILLLLNFYAFGENVEKKFFFENSGDISFSLEEEGYIYDGEIEFTGLPYVFKEEIKEEEFKLGTYEKTEYENGLKLSSSKGIYEVGNSAIISRENLLCKEKISLEKTVSFGEVKKISVNLTTFDFSLGKDGKMHISYEKENKVYYLMINGSYIIKYNVSDSQNIQINPSIGLSPVGVHILWQEYESNRWVIYYANNVGNEKFNKPYKVNKGLLNATNPEIAVDNIGGIHAVWEEEGKINYAYSFDLGYSFSEKEISDSGNNYSPAISVDNRNNVHIVWECNNDEKIYYT
ncbi:MAG: hypothetical protein AB1779_12065, partial [Candidatus Thermoplasmatota archaeon]